MREHADITVSSSDSVMYNFTIFLGDFWSYDSNMDENFTCYFDIE